MLKTVQAENIAHKAYIAFTMNTMKDSQIVPWDELPPVFHDAWVRVVMMVEKDINNLKCGAS